MSGVSGHVDVREKSGILAIRGDVVEGELPVRRLRGTEAGPLGRPEELARVVDLQRLPGIDHRPGLKNSGDLRARRVRDVEDHRPKGLLLRVVVGAVVGAVVEPGELPLGTFALVLPHQLEIAVVRGLGRAGLAVGQARLPLQPGLDPVAGPALSLGHRLGPRHRRLGGRLVVVAAAGENQRRRHKQQDGAKPLSSRVRHTGRAARSRGKEVPLHTRPPHDFSCTVLNASPVQEP